ncbi:hypothetical protein [Nocardia sp. NRRL S-836]|uniref:hypothetical protein n=1 Tax=Nocardia sp. NRRL S-836 TaxID=1519492 RepID=UPI001E33859E|nr:hypothetical protein [Nocardia sp. NRRL S-836]
MASTGPFPSARRLSAMPVRLLIHRSVVSSRCDSSALVTLVEGRQVAMAVIAAVGEGTIVVSLMSSLLFDSRTRHIRLGRSSDISLLSGFT